MGVKRIERMREGCWYVVFVADASILSTRSESSVGGALGCGAEKSESY